MLALKTSLICTVLNEEKSIDNFMDSVLNQTLFPTEFIIVDGGSSDNTIKLINNKIKVLSKKFNIRLIRKKGNRSVGRNEAIRQASYPIILLTDSGCLLDNNWIKNIIKPFQNKSADIIAGYYKGKSKNVFQSSLVPFALVMEDKVDPNNFLPATRSMAMKKVVWEKLKGFDERLSHNEDYAFANKIKNSEFKIQFQKSAIAYWIPRENLMQAFKMFLRFALGDIQANIFRDKVVYIFLRYIFGIYLLILSLVMKSIYLNVFILLCFLTYIVWSVGKNFRYVKQVKGLFYLPLLQFTSDIAVIMGTSIGIIQNINLIDFLKLTKRNKGLFLIILIYIITMLALIGWGIPNTNHPFNYFMDEWHQMQSIKNLFFQGTPNVAGSANGSIFQFFLSGIFLIPFFFLGIINPFAIRSSVLNLDQQYRLFEILRLNTLLFGILSILLFYYICKKYFKVNPLLTTFLFVVNPLWVMLSNYFKYDIALMFWILLSFLFYLIYLDKPNLFNFIFAGIFSAIALAIKLSAIPLLLIYVLVFFLSSQRNRIKWLILGIILYGLTFISLGVPDILLGKGNLSEYLTSNLIIAPNLNTNILNIGKNIWEYLLFNLYPVTFGHIFYYGFIISVLGFLLVLLNKVIKNRKEVINIAQKRKEIVVLLITCLIFVLSLISLKIDARNNRILVLIPFMSIVIGLFITYVNSKNKFSKIILTIIIFLAVLFQSAETLSWISLKTGTDPRQSSSYWINKNIPNGSTLGIENIPIYQSLPDNVLKEYYLKQYNVASNNKYQYEIISLNSSNLPNYVIITNDDIESKYFFNSERKNIKAMLENKGYNKLVQFTPDLKYLSLFVNQLDYYTSLIVQSPLTITIYEKK